MSISEERLQILKMLERGQISADEAASLIEALGEEDVEIAKPKKKFKNLDGKVLKVRVLEGTEDIKVNVNIPLKLVQVLAGIGVKFLPEDKYPELKGLDLAEILAMVEAGVEGNLVDIDSSDGTKVQVFVE
jgi:hypothetical protein